MEMAVEIETTTTVRDALAAKLIEHAAQRKTTPVELMADIVLKGINELGKSPPVPAPIIDFAASARVAVAEAEMKKLRKELADLRLRFQEAQKRAYTPDVETILAKESDARGMKIDQLVRMIIETVARDNLFVAVLDG